jgi:hypothetical protein
MRPLTIVIILFGVLSGLCLGLLSTKFGPGSALNVTLLSLGSGLISTAFISMILDLFWSKERAKAEKEELQPIYDGLKDYATQLGKLEGRFEAFKQLGFNYCYASRNDALEKFWGYANEVISAQATKKAVPEGSATLSTINVVSSSARGLFGKVDSNPNDVQRKWRELIQINPKQFRILLTHPAYAHLRQPAEERSSGDIELEILKTAIYLYSVAQLGESELRFYRGSPTVFSIQAGKHILLNPYPYGKTATDTLCLEFESENDRSYVADFENNHFDRTWQFIEQYGKRVDGRRLVEGVSSLDDIVEAFSECTFLGSPPRLRLELGQVQELDVFISETLPREYSDKMMIPASETPFMDYVSQHGLLCSDEHPAQSEEQRKLPA